MTLIQILTLTFNCPIIHGIRFVRCQGMKLNIPASVFFYLMILCSNICLIAMIANCLTSLLSVYVNP